MKRHLRRLLGRSKPEFTGSAEYWERRYARGGHSGAGSYDRFAAFKAEVLNAFVDRHGVRSAIELGCGDGNQLGLLRLAEYTGVDVSATALAACRARYADDPTKRFVDPAGAAGLRAELALSLDVIYHLVEDEVYDAYLESLFGAATRFVAIYSSDDEATEAAPGSHVRHRRFGDAVAERFRDWVPLERVPNRYPFRGDHRTGSFSDFHFYAIRPDA